MLVRRTSALAEEGGEALLAVFLQAGDVEGRVCADALYDQLREGPTFLRLPLPGATLR